MELVISAAEESLQYAVDEVSATLGPASRVEVIGRGVLLAEAGLGARAAAERVRDARLVFVRHQVPVSATTALSEHPEWSGEVVRLALELVAREVAPEVKTGVQIRDVAPEGAAAGGASRRAVLWGALSAALPPTVKLDARHPERVLSVVLGAGRAWLGLAPVGLQLSAWAGGERHFARRGEEASRAEYKLQEAVEVFGLELLRGARAVDLGAAPGGWTRVLAEAGLRVTAVDPARLEPAVLRSPGVEHVRGRAETFIARALADGARVDLLVNDMRMDAREAARLLVGATRLISPGGGVLTTLKLPKEGLRARLLEARQILEEVYEVRGLRQLFHNRAEVTALLAPR